MKTKINDLREHLFLTLEGLLDEENPMDLDRAEKVAEVGKVIIDSAKVEVDMAKILLKKSELTGEIKENEINLKPSFFNSPRMITEQ